jgi:hypothetical protein
LPHFWGAYFDTLASLRLGCWLAVQVCVKKQGEKKNLVVGLHYLGPNAGEITQARLAGAASRFLNVHISCRSAGMDACVV